MKNQPTSQTLNKRSSFREWHIRANSCSLEQTELELRGLETAGELPIPTMATTTTTTIVNKQTQPQNAEQQQITFGFCKIPENARIKNKLPRDQMKKHTHTAHTAKELTTQQTCAGMAQPRLRDLKSKNQKIILIQQMRVINLKRQHKMPRRLSSKTF